MRKKLPVQFAQNRRDINISEKEIPEVNVLRKIYGLEPYDHKGPRIIKDPRFKTLAEADLFEQEKQRGLK